MTLRSCSWRSPSFPTAGSFADSFPDLTGTAAGDCAFLNATLAFDSTQPAAIPLNAWQVLAPQNTSTPLSFDFPAYSFTGQVSLVGKPWMFSFLPQQLLTLDGTLGLFATVPLGLLQSSERLTTTLGPLQLAGSRSPSDVRINELGEGLSSNMTILSEGLSG